MSIIKKGTFFGKRTKRFPYILDNEPLNTFGSGQLSIINEHKTKDCTGLRPYSTSMFALFSAPLKFTKNLVLSNELIKVELLP